MLSESELFRRVAQLGSMANSLGLGVAAFLVGDMSEPGIKTPFQLIVHPAMTLEAIEAIRNACNRKLESVHISTVPQ